MKSALFLMLLFCANGRLIADFVCNDGKVIPTRHFCDGEPDCDDDSDEIYTNEHCEECTSGQVSCSNGNLICSIHKEFLCNETMSCFDMSPCDANCTSHYRCSNGDCQPRRTVCDGDACNGCQATEEWKNGAGFRCLRNAEMCVLPQEMLHDQIKDCDNGEDLCFSEIGVFNPAKCFRCLDGSMIINHDTVCDGQIDCSDLSDECLCEATNLTICDIVEKQALNASVSNCQVGQFSCDQKCFNRSVICDGTKQCQDAVDERFDFCGGTLKCEDASEENAHESCRCGVIDCKSEQGILCNGIAECPSHTGSNLPDDECWNSCLKPDHTYSYECSMTGDTPNLTEMLQWIYCNYTMVFLDGLSNLTLSKMVTYDQLCDGVIHCPLDYKDESKDRCPDRFRCRSGDMISIKREKVCDGIIDCDDETDESNITCPERFFCPALGKLKVSIAKKHVCDYQINCDDATDEANCTDGRFYCESGSPMFVKSKQKFDGKVDCGDWSDECPIHSKLPEENLFSSRYELISNVFLKVAIWIMGILSVFGNLSVIVGEVKTLSRLLSKSDASSSLQANHLLVLNLAMADTLMGIYLIILGSADASYSGVYCKYKLEWLSSQTCVGMGVLVVMSSETSVMTMILLTSFRLYAIYNPFSSSSRPDYRSVILLLILIWIMSFTIALAPLSSIYDPTFSPTALVEQNPYFSSKVVNINTARNFSQKLLIFGQRKIEFNESMEMLTAATSWKDLEDLINSVTNYNDLFIVNNRFSYYSAHSVCIPKIFVTPEDKAWKFSFGITVFNFMSFGFVAISYLAVYFKSKRSASVQKEQLRHQKKSRALQRKILRLVATDFCCWVPISIMAFINMGGYPIPSVAYAVSAIILLPINSALNPILYSNFLDEYAKKIWQRKTSVNNTNVTGMMTVSYRLSASTRV